MSEVSRSGVRLACKGVELAARTMTRIRRPLERDPTRILLEHYTPAQRAAAQEAGHAPETGPPTGVLAVLIPFRDKIELTETCVTSVLAQKIAQPLKLILLDNGSVKPETAAGLGRLAAAASKAGIDLTTLRVDEPFNYSRLNNIGVAAAARLRPEWLLFLNNDVSFPGTGDLSRFLSAAARLPRLGAAGCTLTYPDGTVQHLFVAPGIKIVAAHPLKGRRLAADCAWFGGPRPVAAVTGAALLVRAEAYQAAGGFDEGLPVVGQDVDLCLKLQRQGLVNWACPDVRLVHHEGATRREPAIDKAQVRRLYDRWGAFLTDNPYVSPRFSRFSEAPAYALGAAGYPWEHLLP